VRNFPQNLSSLAFVYVASFLTEQDILNVSSSPKPIPVGYLINNYQPIRTSESHKINLEIKDLIILMVF